MASNKEAERDGVKTRKKGEKVEDGSHPDPNIGLRVEEYLTSVERELSSNNNPRLTVERTRLLELLESYKKLCQVYEKRKHVDEKILSKDVHTPEIYRVLYPELYEDCREKEKNKLRKNFVKGRPGGVDGCTPRNIRTYSKTELVDTRQREKERFVRLVASAPSPLLQASTDKRQNISRRKLLTSSSTSRSVLQRREDIREKEKERLARIISSDLENNPAYRRRTGAASAPAVKKQTQFSALPSTHLKKTVGKQDTSKNKSCPADRFDKGSSMVRRDVARRSGPGLSQLERRNRLLSLTNKEHQDQLDLLEGRGVFKKDKAVLAREGSLQDLSDPCEPQNRGARQRSSPSSSVSVATQTDEQLTCSSPTYNISPRLTSESGELALSNQQSKLFPVQKEAFITSPRAKLIKDLHGVSPCLPGASPLLTLPEQGACEEKRKRCAYAEALKAQIDEKKRLEEEKRRKELEEDEHVERRAREQQHRLKQEWEREQALRQDWLMQKEAQEETVRQRMVELELEAKELKRRERLRKGGDRPNSPGSGGTPAGTPTSTRQKLSPREVEQLLPQAMRDSMMSSLIMDKPRPKTLSLENNNNTLLTNQNAEGGVAPARVEEIESPVPLVEEAPESKGGESPEERPPSPVIPAIQTDSILRRSVHSSPRLELIQGEKEKEELLRGDRILTQLGVFRRELELEQERLEQRLYEQGSS